MNEPASPLLKDLALQAAALLKQSGFTALWAGGCVRDMLLGRQPKDYDIATDATPDQVLALFPGSISVGKAFGVIKARVGEAFIEIATFRKDADYLDGRRPSAVTFTDSKEDALRRDFTINAMFYDPVAEKVIDYVGGKTDLGDRIIRFVGRPDERIREDHLRILRAIRFACTVDFTLAPDTATALRQHAALIATVSPERIREETTKILTDAIRPGEAVAMMDDIGILRHILPEVSDMKGQEQPPAFHPEGDVFTHTMLMLNMMNERTATLAWAVLLHDIGKPPTATLDGDRIRFNCHAEQGAEMARKILLRLRFSTDEIEAITQTIANHMRFKEVRNMRRATLRRFAGAPTFKLELEMHRLDCLSSHRDLSNHEFLVGFLKELASERPLPPPWITGTDIMALGIPEGREVGKWRQVAYDAQLEGKFVAREPLLEWLTREIKAAGNS